MRNISEDLTDFEDIKEKYVDVDFSNPDNFHSFQSEMNERTNQLITQIDNTLDNAGFYDNERLSDKLIVKLISESGSLFDLLLIITASVGIFGGLALLSLFSNFLNNNLVLGLCASLPFFIATFISYFIQKHRMTKTKLFAEQHYQETQLFITNVFKVKCTLFPFGRRRSFKFLLYFKDENDKVRKQEISEQTFNYFHKNLKKYNSEEVYVLKYPKYKKGYKYHIFYPKTNFQNLSSIKLISKTSVK
jgi:hypothetical protein